MPIVTVTPSDYFKRKGCMDDKTPQEVFDALDAMGYKTAEFMESMIEVRRGDSPNFDLSKINEWADKVDDIIKDSGSNDTAFYNKVQQSLEASPIFALNERFTSFVEQCMDFEEEEGDY